MPESDLPTRIRGILAGYTRRPPSEILRDDHIIFDLEVDDDDASFDLIPHLQREFSFQATAEEWRQVATVGDLEDLIQRLSGQPRAPVMVTVARGEASEARRRILIVALLLAVGVATYFIHKALFFVLVIGLAVYSVAINVRTGLQQRRARRLWKRRRAQGA